MINPKLLESAYIVRNKAINYESDLNYSTKTTSIEMIAYKEFVSKFPSETSYFQPILDVLEYRPSEIDSIKPSVIVEGKNDFYTLLYIVASPCLCHASSSWCILPATGCSAMDALISLHLGWAKDFVIILDDDAEGRKQKQRYIKEFGLIVEKRIFTISDINNAWSNFEMEDIIELSESKAIIAKAFGNVDIVSKKDLNKAIQKLLISETRIDNLVKTCENGNLICDFIESMFHETIDLDIF